MAHLLGKGKEFPMVLPQPLAAELKTNSKEKLLIPRSVAPRFSVQICLICISWETPLFDKAILTFPGGPLRQPFPRPLSFSSWSFLGCF